MFVAARVIGLCASSVFVKGSSSDYMPEIGWSYAMSSSCDSMWSYANSMWSYAMSSNCDSIELDSPVEINIKSSL